MARPFPAGHSRRAGGYDGALFVMTPHGEPVEFVYTRIETPRTMLWRRRDLARRAAKELTSALFNAVTSRPVVIFAKADEVEPGFFVGRSRTPISTCRVARQMASVSTGPDEQGEDVDSDGLHLIWPTGSPVRTHRSELWSMLCKARASSRNPLNELRLDSGKPVAKT